MNPRNLAMGGALLAGMAFASPLNAAIHIFNSPGNVQPAENLQFDSGATGQTVVGTTNNTDTSVTFRSLVSGVNLVSSSNGQARVSADGSPLDSLRFFLTGGKSFGDVEFNLHKAATDTSSVTVTFLGSFGSETRTFDLKNGSNWIAASTDGGDRISAVLFDTNGAGVGDLRQVRLGAFTAVPEPASWAMLLGGFGILGLATRRQKRTAMTLA
jgi:hypothetical protein